MHGLSFRTKKGEIARKIPTCIEIVIPLNKYTSVDKKKPGLAYLTFSSEKDSLRALKTRQGCIIRRNKISILPIRKKIVNKNQ